MMRLGILLIISLIGSTQAARQYAKSYKQQTVDPTTLATEWEINTAPHRKTCKYVLSNFNLVAYRPDASKPFKTYLVQIPPEYLNLTPEQQLNHPEFTINLYDNAEALMTHKKPTYHDVLARHVYVLCEDFRTVGLETTHHPLQRTLPVGVAN